MVVLHHVRTWCDECLGGSRRPKLLLDNQNIGGYRNGENLQGGVDGGT